MEQVLLEKLTVRSAGKKIPRLLWNLKVHCRVHKSPPPAPILSHINAIHTLHAIALRSILVLYFHLHLGLPSDLFSSSYETKIFYSFLLNPMRASCPAHITLVDMKS
jgi:hypothetical protein